ncbi:hemagglutinin repeat-containing protein, partial [Conchiformibius steedae]
MTEVRTNESKTATFAPSLLHFSLMLAMGTAVIVPAAAADIQADQSAPKNQQPTVLNSANGMTQVNIQTPSAGGVSVNQYRQFDVDSRGAILNNSRRNTQTQLGGWIQGNPWLATGEARVIVNQVNSANPSLLNGYIEVGGKRAEVVLANPAGIQVDGGGFINSAGVTLTTGLPFIRNGQLDGIQVAGAGKVGIGKGGLDGRDADYTRILSRAAEINGGIWAKDLQITAGENDFDAAGKHTPRSSTNTPAVAIDTGELGGMYADKITLISTDKDATVRNQGQIFAQAGGVSIDAAGRLGNSGTLASQGSADIRAKQVENSGTVSAKGQLNLRAQSAQNTGAVLSGGELNVRADAQLNNQGNIQAARLDVETPRLDNSGVMSQTGLQGLAVESAGSFTNSGKIGYPEADAPTVGGGSTAAPSAPTPGNSAGAGGSASALTTPPAVQNFAAGSIKTGQALNNSGRIQANGGIDLTLHNGLNNRGEVNLNSLMVSGETLSNQDGKILAQSTDIRTRTVQNDRGQITAGKALNVRSEQVSNRAGKLQSAGNADLNVSQRLDNQGGEITANQALNIHDQGAKTLHLDNTDGSVLGGDVSVQSQSLNNRGKLAAARDLSIDVKDDLHVERDLEAGNALSISTEGSLNNTRNLTAEAAVQVRAKQNVSNRGLINSNGLTRVEAGQELLNTGTGRIYGNHVALAADKLNNREENGKAAVVAARKRLDIGAKQIVNQEGALLSSEGDLAIGGSLTAEHTAQGRAESLINGSAEIRSAGDMVLRTNNLSNRNLHFKTVEREIDGSRKQITEYQPKNENKRFDSSNVTGWGEAETVYLDGRRVEDYTRYIYTRYETQHEVEASSPAIIASGGRLILDGSNLQNDKSHILADGIDIIQNDVQQIDGEGEHRIRVTDSTKQDHWVGWNRRGTKHRSKWGDKANYPLADIVKPIKLNVSVYDKNHQGKVETHFAEGVSTTTIAGANHDLSKILSLNTGIKLPNSSLYTVNPTRSGWLIETDPAFADYRQWLGSDYMLQALSIDPANTHKRLGDGYYEQRLVNEQINRLTGFRRLDGYQSDEEQFKALMNSGVTAAKAMGLTPGIALTAEQVARLTADIVWLETQTVTLPDGSTQTVLVPKVYVVARSGDIKPTGAFISANDLRLNASGTLANSGSLNARKVMVLDVENLRHLNGSARADSLTVRAGKSMDIQGGTFTAKDYLGVHSDGTLNLTADSVTSEKNSANSESQHTNLGRIAGLYVTGANGTLSLSARDLNVQAGKIDNQGTGNTVILAEDSLNIGTLQTGYRHSHTQDEHNYQIDGIKQAIGSNINGKGNVLIQSNGTASIQGSNLKSETGILAVKAKNLNITAAQNSSEFESAHRHTDKRLVGKSTETYRHTDNRTEAVSSVLSGNKVLLHSDGDMHITGSHVVSDEHTQLTAKGKIKVDTAQSTRQSSTLSQKDRSGISIDDGSLLFGKYKKGEAATQGEVSSTVSTIGSINGKVDIYADGNIDLTGADIIAAKGGSISGNNIKDHAVIDTADSELTRFKESNGLFIGAKSNVADAVANIQNSGNRAAQSDNPRLQALYAAKTAYGVKDLAAIAAATQGQGNGAAKEAEGKITIGIGTRRSESHDRAHSETVRKTTVSSEKGSEFVIQAHGKQTPDAGDLLLEGVDFNTGDLVLDAKRDLKIGSTQARQNQESESRSMSAEVGVYAAGQLGGNGASGGIGIYGQGSYSKSGSTLESIGHEESTINADKLTLRSGRNADLKGAVVNAERIEGNIAGNFTLSSEQDTDRYRQKAISGQLEGRYAIYGSDSGAQGNFSYSDSKSDYRSVQEQTKLHAGKGGLDLYVGGHTQLNGAAITSDADKNLNRFSTQTLGHNDLENEAAYQMRGGSISFNTNGESPMEMLGNLAAAPGLAMPVGDKKSSTTHAVLTKGNIEVRGDANGSSLKGIKRHDEGHQPLERIFDLKKVSERQEMAQLVGEVGFRAAGDVAGAMGWKEGSPERLALHGLVGALQAKAAGADIKGAVAGTVATSWLNTQVSEYLQENSNLNENQRKAVQQWLA